MDDTHGQARDIDLQWFGEGDDPAPASVADDQGSAKAADAPPAIGEQGKEVQPPRWIYQADKTLQDDKRLHRFGTLSDAARALLDYEGKLERSVEIPGDKATPEQKAAFYARLGRPEQAEQYALKTPDGYETDGEFLKKLRSAAHEAGLSQGQAQKVLDIMVERDITRTKASKDADETAYRVGMDNLRKLFGVRYEEKMATAKRFMQTVGNDTALAALASKGLDNDPSVVAMFARAGEIVGEDVFMEGRPAREKSGPYPYMNKG